MRVKNFVAALVVGAVVALMPAVARADSLSLVLSPANYVGTAGGSVTLIGTFTNGAGAITWNGFQLNASGSPGDLTDAAVQPIDYFTGGLAGGQVLGPTAVFTINIAATVANGTLFPLAGNSLTIFYIDSHGQESQVDVNFEIRVQSTQPPPQVPEPATMVLLGSGLAGLAALKRRRSRQL